ncbi:hybrid sensor histidine kinase/response regulator [Bradyrhizobium centrosematis]|uniref:hybrid sensor histidine kinase/response regulator n=1 Tax=Bradyrhizobium centrosematis TaxID=1300039 RepID=UPI0021674F8B|nr:hybrid sensor histidine kinase/response regulator [Bradyrhizobium centrosematis]MCS3761278.1 two-component system NtrC family sensor kinase [Bradyrhizobium centrosematis]MCS3770834.1 two-component system NtrC family sensor kinase [Bradyrhizobium centrosematis]
MLRLTEFHKAQKGVLGAVLRVNSSKPSLFWPLRLIAFLSVAIPAVVLTFSIWQTWQTVHAQARERIQSTLDVLHEQTLKSLQTVERSISETNEVLRGMSDEDIHASEAALYVRLKRTQQALPQIESIWAFDRNGHPLVSSTILPVPRDLNNSDRSYFRAQVNSFDTYVSEVVRARVGTQRFFVVSGRRTGEPGAGFQGVIGITVSPENFIEFYRKLSRGRDAFGLVRADGRVLARFPEGRFEDIRGPNELSGAMAAEPNVGFLQTVSPLDSLERLLGYQKVRGYEVYVVAGIEKAALTQEFLRATLLQLGVGVPIALSLLVLSLYALRRAEHYREEVTRREAAEATLKQGQRLEALGQLTGGVAHDFNNLLMVIQGSAQKIKRTLTGDIRLARSLDAIEEAVKRGSTLTRQLLSFSRRQPQDSVVVDLKFRLPQIQEMLQASLRGDIVVRTEIAPDLGRVKVDVNELELALLNLAVNARDAMPRGGQLLVSASNIDPAENPPEVSGRCLAIVVRDTGSGIPPEILDRVFEPFFTTKEVGKGTGLGLSQVYGFARQSGGIATVKSEPGCGTEVTIYIPTTEDEGRPASHMDAQEELRFSGRVLLVEDNQNVSEVTRGLLEDLGFSVDVINDAETALSHLQTSQIYKFLLSDIVMPGSMNGLELARRVRVLTAKKLPILLATGYSEQAQSASDEGFVLLRKPYGIVELRKAVATILAASAGTRSVA